MSSHARRRLPHGRWQSTELDYHLYSDDSHNTIAMAVTPSDGRIHVAFPTHASAIRYTRSVPGVASDPAGVRWSSRLFERTQTSLPGAPEAPVSYTYPQFEMVKGRMLLTYRDGGASNGRQVLLRYDDSDDGTWTYLGRFTSSTGTYTSPTSPLGTSLTRYSYLHGFTANPLNGNLEIAFTWRESGPFSCPGVANHDTGYAYSPDGGLTWHNNDGHVMGVLGSADLISIDDPYVVDAIPVGRGLINQEAQAFDSQGRLHVMTSRVPERDLDQVGGCVSDFYNDRARLARPYHSWRDRDGTWRTMELPTLQGSSGRTKIAFDRHDTAYVVLPDARIIAATARTGWTDWRMVWTPDDVENVSELIIDRFRLQRDGVLTVAYQEPADDAKQDAGNLALNPDGQQFPAAFADSHQPTYPPSLANDGDFDTFWVSAGAQAGDGPSTERPIHMGIDLGAPKRFGEVTMIPRVGFGPRAYTVEVSDDGQTWTEVASEEQAANEGAALASAFRIADFRLSTRSPDRPKQTEPEASPRAFEGTANGDVAGGDRGVVEPPSGGVTSVFAPVTSRYVRLRITDAYDRVRPPRNVQIAELQVRAGS